MNDTHLMNETLRVPADTPAGPVCHTFEEAWCTSPHPEPGMSDCVIIAGGDEQCGCLHGRPVLNPDELWHDVTWGWLQGYRCCVNSTAADPPPYCYSPYHIPAAVDEGPSRTTTIVIIAVVAAVFAAGYITVLSCMWRRHSTAKAAASQLETIGYSNQPPNAVDIVADGPGFTTTFRSYGQAAMMDPRLAPFISAAEYGDAFASINAELGQEFRSCKNPLEDAVLWFFMIAFWAVGGFLIMIWAIESAKNKGMAILHNGLRVFRDRGLRYFVIVGQFPNKHSHGAPTIIRIMLPDDDGQELPHQQLPDHLGGMALLPTEAMPSAYPPGTTTTGIPMASLGF